MVNLIQNYQLSRFHHVLHGFTAFHGLTVASTFLTVLQILSGFFSQTLSCLRKQANAAQFPVKKYRSMDFFSSSIQKLPLKAALDIAVPGYCLERYRKHPRSINLIKVAFFWSTVFATIWTFFRTVIKYTYVEVLLKQAHYLKEKFVILILIIFGWFF